jgi:DNA (cytosine-5)-methyltransferase 1
MRVRRVNLGDGDVGHFASPAPRVLRRQEQALAHKHRELTALRGRLGRPQLNIDLSELGAGMLARPESEKRWKKGNPRAIDLFSGSGGFSTGAKNGGAVIVWAANHWVEAVDIHALNHPGTMHKIQNLVDPKLDWTIVPDHEVMLAAPSCIGHTKAAGRCPPKMKDDARASAWAVNEAVAHHRPEVFVVENVPEMQKWDEADTRWNEANPKNRRELRGRDYQAWKRNLESMGYSLTEQIINAADAGAAMNRERLFIVGHLGDPIHIPQPRKKARPIKDLLDLRVVPITRQNVRKQGSWNPLRPASRRRVGINPLKPKPWAQILRGREDYGDLYILPYYGATQSGRSILRPLGSQDTRSRFAIIDWEHDRMRMLRPEELKLAMGFPEDYILPTKPNGTVHVGLATKMLGNSVSPPVAAHIMRHIRKELKKVHKDAA